MTILDNEQRNTLCSVIKTTRYSKKIVALLRDVSDSLYKMSDKSFMVILESSLDDELLSIFKTILDKVDTSKPMEVEEKLREVIDFLNTVEEITFTVPLHPSKDFTKKLFDWCSQNIKSEILLDFVTNRVMDSGFLMIYKGYYFEYSLENLLNEYFVEHKVSSYFDNKN